MKSKNDYGYGLILAVIIMASLFALTPIGRPFLRILIPVLLISLILFFFIHLYKFLKEKKEKKAFDKTMEGKIEKNIQLCSSQIEKNNQEIIDIRQSIKEIENKLSEHFETSEKSKLESQKIIQAFQVEYKLRKEKLDFYSSCKEKLQTLQYNQSLVRELEEKQTKLRQMQKGHFEDLSNMEAMKTELEYDKHYLESIEDLSSQMQRSNSLDSAHGLQLELVEITKELRKL